MAEEEKELVKRELFLTSSTTDQVLARAPHRHRHRLRHLVEEQQVQLHCLHVLGQHTCDLFDVFQITCKVYFVREGVCKNFIASLTLQVFQEFFDQRLLAGWRSGHDWPLTGGGLGRCRRSATALRRTLAHHRHRHQRLPSGISPAIHRLSGTLYQNKLSKQFLNFSQKISLSAEIMGMLTGFISLSVS